MFFGSRAHGNFHDKSDRDLMILVHKEETDFNLKRNIRDALYGLQLKCGAAIDLATD